MNFYFGRKTNKFHEKLGTVWETANDRCTNDFGSATGENPYGKLHLLKKNKEKKEGFWKRMANNDISRYRIYAF